MVITFVERLLDVGCGFEKILYVDFYARRHCCYRADNVVFEIVIEAQENRIQLEQYI